MGNITQFLGDPVVLFNSALTTDADKASDCAGGVPMQGYEGALFVQIAPLTSDVAGGGEVSKMKIQYSATSNASDAVGSNSFYSDTDVAFPNATDATFTIDSDTNRVCVIDVPFDRISIALPAATNPYLWGATGAEAVATDAWVLIGIPYGKSDQTASTLSWNVAFADTNTVE